jgi:hypothetical protein
MFLKWIYEDKTGCPGLEVLPREIQWSADTKQAKQLWIYVTNVSGIVVKQQKLLKSSQNVGINQINHRFMYMMK